MLLVFKILVSKYFYAKASPKQRKLIHHKSTFDGKMVWSEVTISHALPPVHVCLVSSVIQWTRSVTTSINGICRTRTWELIFRSNLLRMVAFVKVAAFICSNLKKPIRRKRRGHLTHVSLTHPQYTSVCGWLLACLVKIQEVFVLDTMRYEKEKNPFFVHKNSVSVHVQPIPSCIRSGVCTGWEDRRQIEIMGLTHHPHFPVSASGQKP